MCFDAAEIDVAVQQVETKGACTFYQFVTIKRWPERQITVVTCGDSVIAIDSVHALKEVVKHCWFEIDDIHDFARFFGTFLCPPSKRLILEAADLPATCIPHRSGDAAVLYWWDVESDIYDEVTISPRGLTTKFVALGTVARYRLEVDPDSEDR